MLTVLKNRTYAQLFSAQIIALMGTGLLTVALGLLAFDIAGAAAGRVLGIALTIKMIAYVGISPITTAWTANLSPKQVLITADLVRAGIAVMLPVITEAWQIYVLIFILQSASATFTPTFQAVIPVVLPDEDDYTNALSLSRFAYDLEALISPMLAAALLTVMNYHNLFLGTVIGFLASALLVTATPSLAHKRTAHTSFINRATRGMQEFLRNQELRGLMGTNLTVAAISAIVLVNSVVVVRGILERPQADLAILLASYGGGSMVVALGMPRLLRRVSDQLVMLLGGIALPALLTLSILSIGLSQWWLLLILWALMGAASSLILTPSARILRRASTEDSRPSVFAAQFSLSHLCFLLCYPIAGMVGFGSGGYSLSALGLAGFVWAALAWRSNRRKVAHSM